MRKIGIRQILVFLLLVALVASLVPMRQCNTNSVERPSKPLESQPKPPAKPVNVPAFSADSAFSFVKKQVDFGPRVPGTPAHAKCAAWLSTEFKRFGLTVIEQKFTANTYFGALPAVNIIAQYRPELPNRVLLTAHWDSRHIADKDPKDPKKPVLGADDGGSGVGVLLEIARNLKANPVEVGVDIVLFDAEDLGDDRDAVAGNSIVQQTEKPSTAETWCLGSQHWARNPHKAGYNARFGILLDMVGAKGARFPHEGYSTMAAPEIQSKIWGIAEELGYGAFFPDQDGGGITDDHVPVIQLLHIPVVDIISLPNPPPQTFGVHHHTHADNMDIIDPNTLGMVGKVVTAAVYRSGANAF